MEKLIPTEIIDADVVAFIAEYIEILKSCDLSEEFKAKISHLAQTSLHGDEAIISICEKMGINLGTEEDGKA